MANISFPAQVAAVFDTDGKIHPKWLRFRNSLGEIVFLNNLTIEQEGSDAHALHKNFLCSAYLYGRKQTFCLCYRMNSKTWSVEYRSSEKEYLYLLTSDRSEFT